MDREKVIKGLEIVWDAFNHIDNDTERFDYCPACGAKMDGERRESE